MCIAKSFKSIESFLSALSLGLSTDVSQCLFDSPERNKTVAITTKLKTNDKLFDVANNCRFITMPRKI